MPGGLHMHATRGMAVSWVIFEGVSVEDVCRASSHTFTKFYCLNVTAQDVSLCSQQESDVADIITDAV